MYSQPYFVDYVKSLLEEEFSTDVLFKGGLTVKTTIDPNIQAVAEGAAIANIDRYPAASRENLDLDIGMTIIDPKTGFIKAMVGGRDYNRVDQDANGQEVAPHLNHAINRRQPGSSFKAFTLATAISMGMNPNIIINCNSPLTWQIPGQEDYHGQNYGNESMGYISLARATEKSSNTGYLQVAEAVGNQNIIAMCNKLGIDTAHLPDVLTMTLGTGQVNTVEMATAYAAFANGGYHRDPVAINEILSRDGKTIYKHEDDAQQVLSTGAAAAVTDVLEGVLTNGTGVWGRPNINQPVAGKTGTSGTTDEANDLWFCGYTPQYSVAIWMGGYRDVGSIGYFDGTHVTLPTFKAIMEQLLANAPREEFPTGEAPTYKKDSEWKLSKTKSPEERAAEEAKKKEEEKKKAEEEAKKEEELQQQRPTTPGSGGGSTGGSTSGGSTSGGSTSGGSTSGGSTSGGSTSGGSTSGGSTSGGSSGQTTPTTPGNDD